MSPDKVSPYADDHKDLLGWHSDMSNDDYHAGPGLSKSSLDMVHKSIAHLQNRQLVRKETPAMVLGTAVHTAILEPHLWPDGYLRGPDADRRAREWKEAQAEADRYGLMLMKRDDFDKVDKMAASVASHPSPISQLIADGRGIAEGSLFGTHPQTGALVKCRPDYYVPEQRMIIDIKTTKDASADAFAKSCGQFRYDIQEALYTDLMAGAFGGDDWKFVFVAVENDPPFNVGIYQLRPEDRIVAQSVYSADIHKYMQWTEGYEEFTGYDPDTKTIGVPGYFRRMN